MQRVAAYDVGFDSASDEIDLLEVQGEYPRAHLSRFASLYTTGRGNYTISYPNNNTALALPLDNGRSIRGEDVTTSVWQSTPVPELMGLAVQPRSMSLFRAEEMATLAGAIRIEVDGASRRLVNGSELELHDATLIDFAGDGKRKENYLGTIAAGASVEIVAIGRHAASADGSNPARAPIRTRSSRPCGRPGSGATRTAGEIRLVAWVPRAMGGQVIDPPVDRQRGFTAVLVHLRCGPPPNPDGKNYNILAMGPEKGPAAAQRPDVELGRADRILGPGSAAPRRPATSTKVAAAAPRGEP